MTDAKIVYPRGRHRMLSGAGGLSAAFVPLGWIYGAASSAVRSAAVASRPPAPGGVRVVSVGNLEVGGSGKTPLCMLLLAEIRARGARAAFVSRGFRSRAERFPGLTVVAGSGEVPPVAPRTRQLLRNAPDLALEIGDEPALVAGRHPDVPLVVGRDKARAVGTAAAMFAPDYIVVDDAFQTWSLSRHVDVVLLDAKRPFGNGCLLPAGTLREEPGALERADVVLFNGASTASDVDRASAEVAALTGLHPVAAGMTRSLSTRPPQGRVAALSAIARPETFEAMLEENGADIALRIRYPDHHTYTAADIEEIRSLAREARCESIVTTEKDRVRLDPAESAPGFHTAVLEIGFTDAKILEKILKPRTVSAASV